MILFDWGKNWITSLLPGGCWIRLIPKYFQTRHTLCHPHSLLINPLFVQWRQPLSAACPWVSGTAKRSWGPDATSAACLCQTAVFWASSMMTVPCGKCGSWSGSAGWGTKSWWFRSNRWASQWRRGQSNAKRMSVALSNEWGCPSCWIRPWAGCCCNLAVNPQSMGSGLTTQRVLMGLTPHAVLWGWRKTHDRDRKRHTHIAGAPTEHTSSLLQGTFGSHFSQSCQEQRKVTSFPLRKQWLPQTGKWDNLISYVNIHFNFCI